MSPERTEPRREYYRDVLYLISAWSFKPGVTSDADAWRLLQKMAQDALAQGGQK